MYLEGTRCFVAAPSATALANVSRRPGSCAKSETTKIVALRPASRNASNAKCIRVGSDGASSTVKAILFDATSKCVAASANDDETYRNPPSSVRAETARWAADQR